MSFQKHSERERNLEEALKKIFPEEDIKSLLKIIWLAAEKARIYYEEIKMQENLKEDLLLLLEAERILIPFQTSKTIAWEDRVTTFKPGDAYEMPHVIRYLIRKAEETGEWNPSYAVNRYLEEIGEPESVKITVFFDKIKEIVKQKKISPEIILKVSEELNLQSKIGTIIAELKGGGIISPCLRDPSRLRYEINPALMK